MVMHCEIRDPQTRYLRRLSDRGTPERVPEDAENLKGRLIDDGRREDMLLWL
jgi:hypothetical protein